MVAEMESIETAPRDSLYSGRLPEAKRRGLSFNSPKRGRAQAGAFFLILWVLAIFSCTRQEPPGSPGTSKTSARVREESSQSERPSPPPVVRITVPQGTEIHLALIEGISSATSQAGDTFSAKTSDPVVVGDRVAIPAGSTIRGQVTDVVPAKTGLKDKGGTVTLSFDKVVTPAGFSAPMSATVSSVGKSGKKTAGIIGGSAAGGALLGKILGGSTKDAAVGAVVGGAIGTGIAAGTKGKEVDIPAGSHLAITLDQPLIIAVKP